MEEKTLYFLTLRMPTECNPKPYITIDYGKESIVKSDGVPFNSVRISHSVAIALLQCFRRYSIVYGRSELFPFYITPFHYEFGKEYIVVGKFLVRKDLVESEEKKNPKLNEEFIESETGEIHSLYFGKFFN